MVGDKNMKQAHALWLQKANCLRFIIGIEGMIVKPIINFN